MSTATTVFTLAVIAVLGVLWALLVHGLRRTY